MAGISLQERMMIIELARSGSSDPQIARNLQISRHTVRKWRRRGQRQGCASLVSQMGRPEKGALSTFPPNLSTALKNWREEHPGWGPKTLLAELGRHPAFEGQPLPNKSTISRWLKRTGQAKQYEKHQNLPAVCISPTCACHEEWEMDARGHEKIPEAGVIALINVNDVYSKVKLISYPCFLGKLRANHHPTTQDYQTTLRLAFTHWGLPDRLAVDHDSVYYDNQSKSPFPTRFHLWLVALGITLTFGRTSQPRDQAMTERSHQTWEQQVLEGQSFTDYQALFLALQDRLEFLNCHLPCATLGEQPPLLAHPEANSPRRPYRPENEPELMDLTKVFDFLAKGKWFRKASNIGAVCLGNQFYCLGIAWQRAEVIITFDPVECMFVFHAEGQQDIHKPPQGLSCEKLMGEGNERMALPFFQLALPFDWEDRKKAFWNLALKGTTLCNC
jgi:transposase